MENVKGMLSAKIDGRRVFDMILEDLRSIGGSTDDQYDLVPLSPASLLADNASDFLVQAEDHGVPQRRHRIIIVCQSRTKMGPFPGLMPGHECGFGVRLGARGPQMPDACQGALAEGQFKADGIVWGQGLRFRLWRSLKLSPFISRMWTWWVRRSRMAPVRRSDPKTSVHSSNGRVDSSAKRNGSSKPDFDVPAKL
jgi:site-specific DNA-cytosine methylase